MDNDPTVMDRLNAGHHVALGLHELKRERERGRDRERERDRDDLNLVQSVSHVCKPVKHKFRTPDRGLKSPQPELPLPLCELVEGCGFRVCDWTRCVRRAGRTGR